MDEIKFDFNNLLSNNVTNQHGVTDAELIKISAKVNKAHTHFRNLVADSHNRVSLGLEWTQLPIQSHKAVKEIQKLADEIKKYENVIFLGIGGSYLGLKAAQDALCAPYYNEFASLRKTRPKIYFEGNNLDPDTLNVLLKNLNPKKTFVIVISKSGETSETKAAFTVVEAWLKKRIGKHYGRQIIAITDSVSGALRKKVDLEQQKDCLSFRNLALLKGVGGRFSEFNIGLLHLAIAGIDIQELLNGARQMAHRCAQPGLFRNPAYMYAALHTLLYKNKGKSIGIIMPFSETLKSTADWYAQLLAESLGKKYARKIDIQADGTEIWLRDKQRIVNAGRTPVACRGTNDLHSIHQNNVEGKNDKVITFIKVEDFKRDIKINGRNDILSGKSFSELIKLAQEATEWALARENRPSCTIIMPQVSPFYWGGLLFFFEIATAFEGELLNINAFDQPGVEGYKNYMYYKLRKPGIAQTIATQIKNKPLIKKNKFIL